jgi:hypothetical protein
VLPLHVPAEKVHVGVDHPVAVAIAPAHLLAIAEKRVESMLWQRARLGSAAKAIAPGAIGANDLV